MASSEMGNVIDLGRARDLRRQHRRGVEVNWYVFTPMIGFAMWVGLFYGAYWVWHHV